MTKELYFALGHVTARFGRARVSAFEDWFVRRPKRQRRLEIVTHSFLSLPGLVIGSQRIATMHRRLATRMAAYLPLTLREVPMDIPPIREAIQWHISSNNDPAIRWVVERIMSDAQMPVVPKRDQSVISLDEARVSREELTAQFQSDTTPKSRG